MTQILSIYIPFSHSGNSGLNIPERLHVLVDEPESLYPESHEKEATVSTAYNLIFRTEQKNPHGSCPLLKLT